MVFSSIAFNAILKSYSMISAGQGESGYCQLKIDIVHERQELITVRNFPVCVAFSAWGAGILLSDLREFARQRGFDIPPQREIIEEALHEILSGYGRDTARLKENFDAAVAESERLAYRIYLEKETEYGKLVLEAFAGYLEETGELSHTGGLGRILGEHFNALDRFYLSLAQSRKSRAGKGFEDVHNALFSSLRYPFTAQAVINRKPDFMIPSVDYYRKNPMDSIIFTANRPSERDGDR